MDDDFNTGGAVGVLFEMLSALNRLADAGNLENSTADSAAKSPFIQAAGVLREVSSILGLFWEPITAPKGDSNLLALLENLVSELNLSATGDVDSIMQTLIQARADARKAKNFALGDQIRKRLAELGVTLEDRPGGKTDWRVG
jgi:cysteinyl-tRNA synthetase